MRIGVVIVEDEPPVGMSLIEWKETGLSCTVAVSSTEGAVPTICKNAPFIVITDIRMPKMSGLDFIARIRELEFKTRFIVISGYKDFEYARKALKYQVENYLLKPINGHELNTCLKDILNKLRNESIKRKDAGDPERITADGRGLIKQAYLNIPAITVIEFLFQTLRIFTEVT